jgi:3-hydroxyisobutyrate dehydrogenase-like beta-hydroxyacid dehydrogenase
MKVAFVGLGSMGLPIAKNLVAAGHALTVYNRTEARAEPLVALGAKAAASPAAAAQRVDALVTMVSDDAALEAVLGGDEGALAALPRGAVHAAMSTISPALARRLAVEHQAAGVGYVAAPVFGRPDAAAAKKLWTVVAGRGADIERCRPLFDAVGQGVLVVGEEPAQANVVKIAGNFLLAAAIEALGEAFALVRKHGIAPQRFLEIVNGHVLRSPIYENYGKIIAESRWEPAGFTLANGLKDTRLALRTAEEVSVPMPLASLIHDHYVSAVARGWEGIDWAALARVCAADAGL